MIFIDDNNNEQSLINEHLADRHEPEEFTIRQEKIKYLNAHNYSAWPEKVPAIAHTAKNVLDECTSFPDKEYSLAGRIRAIRKHGKTVFATLQDTTGPIQIYLKKDLLGEIPFTIFDTCIDIGDIIYVFGTSFKTKMGEITISVSSWLLLSKCMRPLPEKFHGLTDTETKYRQRYLDLIVNKESRECFKKRAEIIKTMRAVFDEHGYMEVETPMLHPIAGGALARPFKTHHNALDMELYLRIAPELYLKRLVIGGFDRVYEINRNFRNEGISTRHNPEFTMVEFYTAYADYETIMNFTEHLLKRIVSIVYDNTQLSFGNHLLDFESSFARITMLESVAEKIGYEREYLLDRTILTALLGKNHIHHSAAASWGECLALLFEHFVEKTLIQPTFITQFPTDISPLAKKNQQDSRFTDRFELFVAGMELGNGFNELNDPFDQAKRFKEQLTMYESNEETYHAFDADYIKALEHALPPTAGVGIGIDRLVMFLTNQHSIRDVILFPTLRKKHNDHK